MLPPARSRTNLSTLFVLMLSLLGAATHPQHAQAALPGLYWPWNPTTNVVGIYPRDDVWFAGIGATMDSAIPQVRDSIYGFSTNRIAVQYQGQSSNNYIEFGWIRHNDLDPYFPQWVTHLFINYCWRDGTQCFKQYFSQLPCCGQHDYQILSYVRRYTDPLNQNFRLWFDHSILYDFAFFPDPPGGNFFHKSLCGAEVSNYLGRKNAVGNTNCYNMQYAWQGEPDQRWALYPYHESGYPSDYYMFNYSAYSWFMNGWN